VHDQRIGEAGHRFPQRGRGGVDASFPTSGGQPCRLIQLECEAFADEERLQRVRAKVPIDRPGLRARSRSDWLLTGPSSTSRSRRVRSQQARPTLCLSATNTAKAGSHS